MSCWVKYKEIEGKYQCDNNPSHVFTAAEVVLKPWGDTPFNILGVCVVAVDAEDNVLRCNTDMLKPTDRILHCPKCNKAHLFGFNTAA